MSGAVQFPVTVVEVSERTNNSRLDFDPMTTRLGGNEMTGCWFIGNNIGLHMGVTPAEEIHLFTDSRL